MKGSFWGFPLSITRPLRMLSRSPGPATTRLMKFTFARSAVGLSQAAPSGGWPSPHMLSCSAPSGGWNTTMFPTSGSPRRPDTRLTSTRWPTCRVGTIDSLGMRYGLTRNAWIPSASPSATTTIRTSSSSEPDADDPRSSKALVRFVLGIRVALGSRLRLLLRRGLLGDGRVVRGLGERLLVDGVAGNLVVGGSGRLGGGIVQQAGLDDLLRPRVAALANTCALADATAQVIELGAPDIAAGGDLDLLDLRRVHGERALYADAEGLLAHGERLAHALALALDDHTLEHLGAAAGALDHLEVDSHPVAGGELRDAAKLRPLETVDDGAHGEKKPRSGTDLAERAPIVAKGRPLGLCSARGATAGSARDGRTAARPEHSSRATGRGACSAGTPARPPKPR